MKREPILTEKFPCKLDSYKTVKELSKMYGIKESSIRWHLHKNSNNIKECRAYWGGKLLFHHQKFVAWMEDMITEDDSFIA